MTKTLFLLFLTLCFAPVGLAGIIISEVHPTGSSASYGADFFELTNTGTADVDISGWMMDDNSHKFSKSVSLRKVNSIAAGQSVVFIETTGKSADDATLAAFEAAWFGTNIPAGLVVGVYNGDGVGLGSSNDEVNVYDKTGARVVAVGWGSGTTGVSFDNASGIGGITDPLPLISTLSVVGVNAAFLSPTGEIGSPGVVPEPGSLLGMFVFGAMGLIRRRGSKN